MEEGGLQDVVIVEEAGQLLPVVPGVVQEIRREHVYDVYLRRVQSVVTPEGLDSLPLWSRTSTKKMRTSLDRSGRTEPFPSEVGVDGVPPD